MSGARRRSVVLALVAAAALSPASGCTVDAGANPATRCTDTTACLSPLVCYRGFCVRDETATCPEGTSEACYDGPDGTRDVGVCRAGMRTCLRGTWTACLDQAMPSLEACNDRDDDCDGATDDLGDASCPTALPGACETGHLVCNARVATCMPVTPASREVCNGIDDDCDGATDDAMDLAVPCYPGGTVGCAQDGDGIWRCDGICATGIARCVAGTAGCEGAATPTSATDGCASRAGVDDDCDGMVDEDCGCTSGAMQPCYGGPDGTRDVGECRPGMQTCVGGSWGDCTGDVRPAPETCANAGADDDCNGTPDDVPMLGTACTDPSGTGPCAAGHTACAGGGALPTCVPDVAPGTVPEACNGLDDDCDGSIDETFDLTSDPAHCGTCTTTCAPAEFCSNGLCCDTALVGCGTACVDTSTDARNCGTCGNSCGSGACCAGVCVDTTTSAMHCGACDTPCASGEACTGGHCCAAALTWCGGACVDTETDVNHCGRCGNACRMGRSCCAGMCSNRC